MSGARSAFGALVVTSLLGALAVLTGQALVFPSLGPTAYLMFATPLVPAASPRNAVGGHLIGLVGGVLGLTAFGLWNSPPNLVHMDWSRAGAAVLALTFTCGGMVWGRLSHPPAGATTLIVALGVLHTPLQLATILVGVLVLLVAGSTFNRLAGVPYPLWKVTPPVEPVEHRQPEPVE
ncbi:HPP family protein [Actinokineospora enzanensis]|uniref:HPP family protein n=1 Tax=Actinokineospora enzanensis TaxID=155975 RepID=UPI00037B0CBA|nr:HPP family protein [Actinokineospora enzanensis]